MAENDPEEVLLLIHDVLRSNFSKIMEWGSLNFDYWSKMVLQKVSDGYIKAYKI